MATIIGNNTAQQGEQTLVKHECIPFASVPHSTPLYLDYLSHSSRVAPFYPHKPTLDAVVDHSRQIDYPADRRAKVADILERQNRSFGASAKTIEAISRFRSGAVAAISGQQVGLFGGPLYSVLKAVSAIQIARDLTARGVEAVPIFWLATEDHDLAEVNHTFLSAGGELKKFASTSHGRTESPVGQVVFGSEIDALAAEFARSLGEGPLAQAVIESYRSGENFGSAFARLFARLFGEYGLILLDPLDAELHAVSAPVLRQAAERAHELDAALLERGKQLRLVGYHEQVKVTSSSTLLFSLEHGQRKVLHLAGDDFVVGSQKVERAEMLALISSHPELFSPNVLLRPVVQDYLLPTAVYFGGAAEIAYFAQCAVVYEKLLGKVTPVMPRFSATVVSAEMQGLLQKYRLGIPDLFRGVENLRENLATVSLAPAMLHEFNAGSDAIRNLVQQLQAHLRTLDPTLVDAAARSGRKMQYQLSKIARKTARAELRRTPQLEKEADAILGTLFPAKDLQERTLPGVLFLAQNSALIPALLSLAGEYCNGHHLVSS